MDGVMMRVVDIVYALPFIFLVIVLVVFFGRTLWLIFVAIGAVEWLDMARIVRGQTLSLKRREFVLAAQALGATDGSILARHIVPNISGPIVAYLALLVPRVILAESFLSFLGLGVQEPADELGHPHRRRGAPRAGRRAPADLSGAGARDHRHRLQSARRGGAARQRGGRMTALLRFDGLGVRFGAVEARARLEPVRRAGRDGGDRRRDRLGQERGDAGGARPAAAAGRCKRPSLVRGARSPVDRRAGTRQSTRPRGVDRLPGAAVGARPLVHRRRADRGSPSVRAWPRPPRGVAAERVAARRGRHSGAGSPCQDLSPRALGRPAPAGRYRDGDRLRAQADHRRRADHRARRYGRGENPGAAGGSQEEARAWPWC